MTPDPAPHAPGELPRPTCLAPGLGEECTKGLWVYGGPPPSQRQGWKLYVSCTPYNALATLEAVVPLLARHGVHFKYVRRLDDVHRLNSGVFGYSQIGKCLVAYLVDVDPALVEDVREVLQDLPEAGGPAVPFARPLDADLPLYYRFGAFVGGDVEIAGRRLVDVRDDYEAAAPAGVEDWLSAVATPVVECPEFRSFLLDYPVFSALRQQGKSGVFAALDLRSETYREVVLKVGYRYGAVQPDGSDGRTFVRHEVEMYGVLAAEDLAWVAPPLIDSYDDAERVVLVLDRVHGDDLLTLKLEGRLTVPDVAEAWRLLGHLHRRGIFVGDAKIGNYLRSADGRIWLVDLESAGRTEQDLQGGRVLRTFALQDAEALSASTRDQLHFLASVLWRYEAPGRSDADARVFDTRRLLDAQPETDTERWAAAQLRNLL